MTPKLGDFGLTKILSDTNATVNVSGAGTVTHLAPEMFEAGTLVTTAVDSYAFGILMYELYCCQRAFAGLPHMAIAQQVYHQGLRPVFPAGTPPDYVQLASDCWRTAPAERPTFGQIIGRLEAMEASMGGGPAAGGACGGPFGAGRACAAPAAGV